MGAQEQKTSGADTPGAAGAGNARCPRCGASFHCGSIAHEERCACAAFALSAETLHYLRETYNGCLCPSCLRRFVDQGLSADDSGVPVTPD